MALNRTDMTAKECDSEQSCIQNMNDWQEIAIPTFDAVAESDYELLLAVDEVVLERLPYTFESKRQYLEWKHALAEGLEVDPASIYLVGSAATGRSLNPGRKRFGVFKAESDIDVAVVSQPHFDSAWSWLRTADPLFVTGGEEVVDLIKRHRDHYVFDGVISSNDFLSHLPFGDSWSRAMRSSQRHLPDQLSGRRMSIRIYRDQRALRAAVAESFALYRRYRQESSEYSTTEDE